MTDGSGAPRFPGDSGDSGDSGDVSALAALIALDAVDDDERAAIERTVAAADPRSRKRYEDALRDHREALAEHSETSAVAPPGRVLGRVLARLDDPAADDPAADDPAADDAESADTDAGDTEPTHTEPTDTEPTEPTEPASLDGARKRRGQRRRRIVAAVTGTAAAVAIAAGGIVIGEHTGGGPQPPTAQSVLAEPDVHTASAAIGGGTVSVAFSRDADAAVLVMHDVPPPSGDTVYQFWLTGPEHEPKSVGMMTPQDVRPKTQTVLDGIAGSAGLGISVEPEGGSPQPTDIVAAIPLT